MFLHVGTQQALTVHDYFGWYDVHLIVMVAMHVQC
jgi:hypothetical protein